MHFCTVTALGLMSEGDFSARLCTDAYISALAICDGSHSTEHRQHERAAKIHLSSAVWTRKAQAWVLFCNSRTNMRRWWSCPPKNTAST
jgi:hypothetical protein